jgi:N-acetyl-gamma-glutamyl-phosphate reductase
VKGSNYCDIGLTVDTRNKRLITISAIDNLLKGGSGQAMQNMNIMMGFDEGLGITQAPLFP